MSERETIARWESRSGKHWVELYRDRWGFSYSAPDAGGSMGAKDEAESFAYLTSMIDAGYFQPDKNVTPMRRVR